MKNTIELTPYLPECTSAKSHAVSDTVSRALISGAEVLVTLLIGACFFVSTCAFIQIL